MPLSLDQYAAYLDTRDLPWPAAPLAERVKAKPYLVPLPGIRAVLWNVYGTLLSLHGGEVWFTHPQPFAMQVALDKTVQEFKMWGSMTRRPGQPADYLAQIYEQVLIEHRMQGIPGERFPEISSERIWETIVKKLFCKDYQFDTGFFGSLNEFSRKVAYFFHSSLQGTACYPGAANALLQVRARGLRQGLLADGQCFTSLQLQRGLVAQNAGIAMHDLQDEGMQFFSCDARAKKPAERLFRLAQAKLAECGIAANEALHIGSSIARDLVPARRLGFRTALFAGDKTSLHATPEQLKEPASRPDVLLTELSQLEQVLA